MTDSFVIYDFFLVNSDERLRLNSCLDDYKLQEIVVVSKEDLKTKGNRYAATAAASGAVELSLETSASQSKMFSKSSKMKNTSSEPALAHAGPQDKKKRGFLGMFFGKSKKGSVPIFNCPFRFMTPVFSFLPQT